MARTQDHLAELLKLPIRERAKVAYALLDSLDEEDTDAGVEEAQIAELIRRIQALDLGQTTLIDGVTARARVMARLRSLQNQ